MSFSIKNKKIKQSKITKDDFIVVFSLHGENLNQAPSTVVKLFEEISSLQIMSVKYWKIPIYGGTDYLLSVPSALQNSTRHV